MTYEPKPGDIGLVSIRGRVGATIRVGQWLCGDGWTNYQHAFVLINSDNVVEAMPEGARMAPVSQYAGRDVAWLRCPPAYASGVAEAALGFIGVPYSFVDYAAIALHRLHVPTPKLRAYIQSSHRQICSQLADTAAQKGGWHIWDDGRWSGSVTPGDLYKAFSLQEPGKYVERIKASR